MYYVYNKGKEKDTLPGYLATVYHHWKFICQAVTINWNLLTHFSVFKFCKLVTKIESWIKVISVYTYSKVFRNKSKCILKISPSANMLPSTDKNLYFITLVAYQGSWMQYLVEPSILGSWTKISQGKTHYEKNPNNSRCSTHASKIAQPQSSWLTVTCLPAWCPPLCGKQLLSRSSGSSTDSVSTHSSHRQTCPGKVGRAGYVAEVLRNIMGWDPDRGASLESLEVRLEGEKCAKRLGLIATYWKWKSKERNEVRNRPPYVVLIRKNRATCFWETALRIQTNIVSLLGSWSFSCHVTIKLCFNTRDMFFFFLALQFFLGSCSD